MSDELKPCPFCGHDASVYRMHVCTMAIISLGAVLRVTPVFAVLALSERLKNKP